MFIDAANLYGALLKERVERAKDEVSGLVKIFSEFHVPSDGWVLDLACGIGRHSVALAEKGYKVVGVDISPAFISRAKEMTDERGVGQNCDFRVGDMRRISEVLNGYREKFNVILNLFTSLGYYTEETDKHILTQLLEFTAQKGVLIIDVINRDWLIRHFRPRDTFRIRNDLVLVEEGELNLENSRMKSVWRL